MAYRELCCDLGELLMLLLCLGIDLLQGGLLLLRIVPEAVDLLCLCILSGLFGCHICLKLTDLLLCSLKLSL